MIVQRQELMPAAEAARYGIEENERERYYQVIGDPELDLNPPRWFRLVYVDLGDGGDPVPVAERWYLPS